MATFDRKVFALIIVAVIVLFIAGLNLFLVARQQRREDDLERGDPFLPTSTTRLSFFTNILLIVTAIGGIGYVIYDVFDGDTTTTTTINGKAITDKDVIVLS